MAENCRVATQLNDRGRGRSIGYIGFVSGEDDELTEEFFIVIGELTEWGKGHGKRAMGWLFDKSRDLGLSKLSGQVLGNNEQALAFYKKLGFEVVEERERRFERRGRRYSTLLIEKKLD